MALTDWFWRRLGNSCAILAAGALCLAASPTAGLSVSATIDKTKVAVGEQLTLTITFSGDLMNVVMDPRGVPPSFSIIAQSRSQNIHVMQGRVERSVSLIYALVPRETGKFQLGPFHVQQGRKEFVTDPLDVEVIRNVLPPPSAQPVERLTI